MQVITGGKALYVINEWTLIWIRNQKLIYNCPQNLENHKNQARRFGVILKVIQSQITSKLNMIVSVAILSLYTVAWNFLPKINLTFAASRGVSHIQGIPEGWSKNENTYTVYEREGVKVPMKWKIKWQIQENAAFLFEISFFILKILTFLYYGSWKGDDIINCGTKMVKYWIKNISRNIGAVFFKLSARIVHHERNKMTPVVLLPWQQFCRFSCLN